MSGDSEEHVYESVIPEDDLFPKRPASAKSATLSGLDIRFDLIKSKPPTTCTAKKVLVVTGIVILAVGGIAGITLGVTLGQKNEENEAYDGNKNEPNKAPPTGRPPTTSTSRVSISTTSPTSASSASTTSTTSLSSASTTTSLSSASTTTTTSTSSASTTSTTSLSSASTTTSTTSASTSTATESTNVTRGVWSVWGSWTTCPVTCGGGVHKRYRTCVRQSDTDYPCQGDSVETDICNMDDCPEPPLWSTWGLWGSCDVTCGGGTQTRDRTCQSTEACVGDGQMTQPCNSWACPDCSQTCSEGSLNVECDACVCGTTITVTVKTSATSAPVYGASIYQASAPTREIAQTNGTGHAVLTSVCLNSEIQVSRELFQTTVVQITSSNMDITLSTIEYPSFTTMPKSKVRFEGENVTFCCIATGNPPVTYYEWFKNGVLLDGNLYPNGTHLFLQSLATEDSGEYRCRTNTPVGAAKSDAVTLQVKGLGDNFCSDALEQKRVSLPSDCVQPDTGSATYEVGSCNNQKCRQSGQNDSNTCGEATPSCCAATLTEFVTIQCSGYALEMVVVKGCGCSSCPEPTLTLTGVALGYEDDAPLRYGTILVNGLNRGYTSRSGIFTLSLATTVLSHTITLKDTYYREFLEATQTIDVLEGESSAFVVIRLLRAAPAVEITSSVENVLYIGPNATDGSIASASLTIPPNAFYSSDGSLYTGSVQARITFVSSDTVSDVNAIPGRFVATDDEGDDVTLESAGVFNLLFQDTAGNELYVGESIQMEFNSDLINTTSSIDSYKLFGLDPVTGKWVEIKQSEQRRKRRQANFAVAEVDPTAYRWYNCDIYWRVPRCYVKTILYDDVYAFADKESLSLDSNAKTVTFFSLGNLYTLLTYFTRTMYVTTGCVELPCGGRTALIEMVVNNENALPLDPSIQEFEGYKEYTVTGNGRVINITATISTGGPFFSSNSLCLANTDKGSMLHFAPLAAEADIYTFKLVEGPIPGFDPGVLAETDAHSWYINRICLIKITLSGSFTNVRLRGRSEHSSKVLGIREVTPESIGGGMAVACVEFRCSFTNDLTTLTIDPIRPANVICNIDYQNDGTNQMGNQSVQSVMQASSQIPPGVYENLVGTLDMPVSYEVAQNYKSTATSGDMHNVLELCRKGGDLTATTGNTNNRAFNFHCQNN